MCKISQVFLRLWQIGHRIREHFPTGNPTFVQKSSRKNEEQKKIAKRKRGTDLSHAVDLLVDLRAVVVTLLTGTRHREADSRRMPRSDTRNLTQTLVRLPGKLLRVPPRRHTCKQTEEPLKSTQTQYTYASTLTGKACNMLVFDQKEGSMCFHQWLVWVPGEGHVTCSFHHVKVLL